jgi:hypothetical protein
VLIHNDVDAPFPKPGSLSTRLNNSAIFSGGIQIRVLLGALRIGQDCTAGERPVDHCEEMFADPALKHINVDISWDEIAKCIVATPETIKATADLINKFPNRFIRN